MSNVASAAAQEADRKFSLLRMLEPEVLAAPYEHYRALREYEPVHWDPYMHAWVVTSYPEAVAVLMTCSADRTPQPEVLDALGLSFMTPFATIMRQQMIFMDGANHARLRGICAAAFTPRRVKELRDVVQSVADDLIDKFIESGKMEMIEDFANPFPAVVTAKLLGIPMEDLDTIHKWVPDIAEVLGNFQHHPTRLQEIVKSLEEIKSYVAARMEVERKEPTGGLINALMTAEVNGQRLTDDEVIANSIITLVGGHETTTNLIATGFLTLLENPKSLEQLRSQPDTIVPAVEELLRYVTPSQHTGRIAPTDMQLGGKTIPKGARVVAVMAAANRDPNRFPDPDRLDLARTDNRHLAFGWAAHFCFGAPLARMEGQIGFNTLLKRLVHPALVGAKPRFRDNAGLRGLTSLHIKFTPGPRVSPA
jgi:pimeloyl-[acyl-carrier protein] synthase